MNIESKHAESSTSPSYRGQVLETHGGIELGILPRGYGECEINNYGNGEKILGERSKI